MLVFQRVVRSKLPAKKNWFLVDVSYPKGHLKDPGLGCIQPRIMHLAERFSEEPGESPQPGDTPDAGRVSSHFGSMAPRNLAQISLRGQLGDGSLIFFQNCLGRKNQFGFLRTPWAAMLGKFNRDRNNVEFKWFKHVCPPAIKHGLLQISQFVGWFYHSNILRE